MIDCKLVNDNQNLIYSTNKISKDKHGNSNCNLDILGLDIESLFQKKFPDDKVVDGVVLSTKNELFLIEFKTGKEHQKPKIFKTNSKHQKNDKILRIDFYGVSPGGIKQWKFQDSELFRKYNSTVNNMMHSKIGCCNKCSLNESIKKKEITYILVEENIDPSFIAMMFNIQGFFSEYGINFLYIPYKHFNKNKINNKTNLNLCDIK